ncbi:protein kinase domain-containing protein [Priestia abyssalis]|uniref:protein kinase domain-containing protein n=1 Tax=Priestia abyssalis TaxID=1221450 RepID=UPI000994B62D|nr:protein kinase [Priestia abyssalis]
MSDFSHLCFGCMENKGEAQVCPFCGWVEGTPAEAPQHLRPGTVLHEKYVLGRVLGHGGFGITYLAWDLNLDMKLAIKEYMPRDFATRSPEHTAVSVFTGQLESHFEHGLKKFLDEAKTLAQFNAHPGIVGVRDFFRENGTAYLVMYYLEGIDFKQYLEMQGGKIPFGTALKIMIPVMDALREVHGTGTLHRDISPDNIYITAEGQVKVLDFGAARHAMNEFSKSISVILKPGYAPEEQYRSKGKQGPWTDVYAAAATFYRAIVGHVPPESLDRLEEDTIERPSKLGADIPPEAEAALMKALAVKQTDRYQIIGEFQQALLKSTGEGSGELFEEKGEIKPEKVEKKETLNLTHQKKVQPQQPKKKNGGAKWAWIAGGAVLIGIVSVGFVLMLMFIGLAAEEPAQPNNNNHTKQETGKDHAVKQVTVPNVLDSTEKEAKTFLTNAGLKVGNVVYVESAIVRTGHVVKQSIEPEQKAKEHDAVNLEISKGIQLPVDAAAIQTKKMELVNEYWNKGHELDQKNDLNGALTLYIQARDMAAELVKNDGDFDAQYAQGVLSRNIASIKGDLGYYYYGLQDAEESIVILEDLYAKDPVFQKNPKELASAYETLSYLQIFNQSPKEAIASAEKGLGIDPNQVWLQLDLAHAYLLNGDYEIAADLYMNYKDTAVDNGKTFKDYVLDDFKRLKEAGITHPDMEKIEALLTGGSGDQGEIEVTIHANAISMEEENVAGYMSTIDPQSPVYSGTEKMLTDLFHAYEQFEVNIESIEVLEINGNTAKVKVAQKLSYSDGTQTYESSSTFIHTLIRSDGVFKWLIQQSEKEGN